MMISFRPVTEGIGRLKPHSFQAFLMQRQALQKTKLYWELCPFARFFMKGSFQDWFFWGLAQAEPQRSQIKMLPLQFQVHWPPPQPSGQEENTKN
ncbi:hypothetical protein GBA52_022725 [Prunus armeniaca]|nr:hypothetical protein GBA52_022725 [Prunus armeniaca]